MKVLFLAAAALSLGMGAVFAQCAPAALKTPLGQPWTKQKLAEQAAHDRAAAANRQTPSDAQRSTRLTTPTPATTR